jgi:hypothetical protein
LELLQILFRKLAQEISSSVVLETLPHPLVQFKLLDSEFHQIEFLAVSFPLEGKLQ